MSFILNYSEVRVLNDETDMCLSYGGVEEGVEEVIKMKM